MTGQTEGTACIILNQEVVISVMVVDIVARAALKPTIVCEIRSELKNKIEKIFSHV